MLKPTLQLSDTALVRAEQKAEHRTGTHGEIANRWVVLVAAESLEDSSLGPYEWRFGYQPAWCGGISRSAGLGRRLVVSANVLNAHMSPPSRVDTSPDISSAVPWQPSPAKTPPAPRSDHLEGEANTNEYRSGNLSMSPQRSAPNWSGSWSKQWSFPQYARTKSPPACTSLPREWSPADPGDPGTVRVVEAIIAVTQEPLRSSESVNDRRLRGCGVPVTSWRFFCCRHIASLSVHGCQLLLVPRPRRRSSMARAPGYSYGPAQVVSRLRGRGSQNFRSDDRPG